MERIRQSKKVITHKRMKLNIIFIKNKYFIDDIIK